MFVEVFTAILPFILLLILAAIIAVIVYLFKLVKRYLKNGEIAENRVKMEQEDIKEIKQQLDRIEKLLNDVERFYLIDNKFLIHEG